MSRKDAGSIARAALMAAEKLFPVKFQKSHAQRADVQAFRCGNKPHETPLADWKNKALEELSLRTKIWLYEVEFGQALFKVDPTG